jgi:hypothetical protein
MAEHVLTTDELNRAVLARQLLLQRSALPPERAVEQVGGLQTQYSPSGYIGLWSRVAGFRREMLTGALTSGTVVQGWAMRCTIHMLSAPDYWPLIAAVRAPRRVWWVRAHGGSGIDMGKVADAVRGYLADGPLKQAEIQRLLAADGFPREVWSGVQLWLELVRVPPAGTWGTPRAHVYGLAERTVPLPESLPSVEEGEELLVRRYLEGFGPASAKDVSSFCGWTVTGARKVLERLEPRRFRDESGGELFDLPGAPLPPGDAPAPVRFLGQWEAVLLVHARRTQILPEEYRPLVFGKTMPQSVPTFLVDGRVAGTWRYVEGSVRCEPFHVLPRAVLDELHDEGERLTEFYAGG